MPTPIPDTASVTLALGASSPLDREALARSFAGVQSVLFRCRGVIPPLMEIRVDERLRGDAFVLLINGREAPPPASDDGSTRARELAAGLPSSPAPDRLVAEAMLRIGGALWERAPDLLSTELVEHYLFTLEPTHRDLIRAVRQRFSAPELARRLAESLGPEDDATIRNLPAVLEGFLASERPWR